MIGRVSRFYSKNTLVQVPQGLSRLSWDMKMSSNSKKVSETKVKKEACGDLSEEPEDDEMEEMFVQGPVGMEWGGPTRGGTRPEPTRFGDWERKGRVSDF